MVPRQETNAAQRNPAPQRKRVECWLSLFGMLLLSVPAGVVLRIDILNNYAQGTRYLHELGLIMAVAAVAYAVVPMVAAVLGRWCWMTVGGTVIAGAMTVAAAYLAYTSALNAGIDNVVTAQAQAETAREKRAAAQAALEDAQIEAGRIAETMSSAALKRLYDDAIERKLAESKPERGGCGRKESSLCRTAERDAADYLRRVGDAEAKEKAERRAEAARAILAEAETVADTAPATQELAAIDLAMRINTTPEEAARLIARGLALLSIALTIMMGLLAHRAMELGMHAFGIVPLATRRALAPRGLEVVPPPKPALIDRAVALVAPPKREGAKRGRKPMTPEERVMKFVKDRLNVGEGAMTGDEMTEAFNRWWYERWPDERPMRPRDFAPVLARAGVEKGKVRGRMRYKASVAGLPEG